MGFGVENKQAILPKLGTCVLFGNVYPPCRSVQKGKASLQLEPVCDQTAEKDSRDKKSELNLINIDFKAKRTYIKTKA